MPAEALKCKECHSTYELDASYVCEQCFGPLEVSYDHSELDDPAALRRKVQAGPASIWRYADFLPFPRRPKTALDAGLTPLIRSDRLARRLGVGEVYVKNDAANPTHSFKDRVVAVAAAKAVELGYEALACASTGNLAGATAAAAAALGLPAYIFVPADLEREKIVAAAAYGATVFAVDGSYDDVNRLCSELAYERPWAFVNVSMRAYYAEGSKTIALETAEDLGWRAPDRVVAPIASGSLYTKILQGFRESRAAGLVAPGPDPIMHGAQGEGCAPVATAFAAGAEHVVPVRPTGLAKSLAIGNPADGVFALDVARSTGGTIESAGDDELVDGIRLIARTTGIFTETAGGVTAAVLRRLAERGEIRAGETVVAYITGDGLKTIDAVVPSVATIDVPADIEAVDAVLDPAAVT
jgi:threonine synthase